MNDIIIKRLALRLIYQNIIQAINNKPVIYFDQDNVTHAFMLDVQYNPLLVTKLLSNNDAKFKPQVEEFITDHSKRNRNLIERLIITGDITCSGLLKKELNNDNRMRSLSDTVFKIISDKLSKRRLEDMDERMCVFHLRLQKVLSNKKHAHNGRNISEIFSALLHLMIHDTLYEHIFGENDSKMFSEPHIDKIFRYVI